MMKKAKEVLTKWYVWVIIGIPLAAIILGIALTKAEPHMPARTVVPPEVLQGEIAPIFTASDGVVVIKANPAESITEPVVMQSTEQFQREETVQYTMPSEAALPDGSTGRLTIPKLYLSVDVFESADQMEAMTLGAAHFKSTSSWDGNVGLSAHNVNFDGTDGYFKNLYRLSEGDEMMYTTQLGERSYIVSTVQEIEAKDWSHLKRTADDRLTLITCITGKPNKRLMVQGVAKTATP